MNNTQIINNIVQVKYNNKQLKTYEIKKDVSKYSNTKTESYKLYHNGKGITRSNEYEITYNCITCRKQNKILLTQFMRKFNRNNLNCCKFCRNLDETKRNEQSMYMIKRYKTGKIKKDKITKIITYDSMTNDFKKKYQEKHLTFDEFDKIKNKIIKIQNLTVNNWEKYTYIFAKKNNNQAMFNPYLYDIENDKYIKLCYIKWKCDVCDSTFINRDLYVQKNQKKLLCKECKLCNKIFKIKKTTNIYNKSVLWQSKLELDFIEWCNNNNIEILNGPNINYYFNGKNRKYKLDFKLPSKKMLIEIKDNHCWHKKQVETGKWDAKEKAALKYLKSTDDYKSFDLVFPKDLKTIKQKIINKI